MTDRWREPGRRTRQMRLIPAEALRDLYARSDAQGAWRTAAHLLLLVTGAFLIRAAWTSWWLPAALLLQGIFFVSLFAAMHECVHYSAFRTRALNDAVAWITGFGILFNATYYRQFHYAHHRYAQDPTRDPELLTAPPPRSRAEYWLRATALPYWRARATNLWTLSRGRFDGLDFIPPAVRPEIARSVRVTCLALSALIIGSVALRTWALVWYWLLPLALALPLLRLYLLTEHTGCSETDDGLTNTRTTLSLWPVRFLMWNLPYHAEHHLFPSIPFHRLPAAHGWLRAHLGVVSRGYVATNRELYRPLPRVAYSAAAQSPVAAAQSGASHTEPGSNSTAPMPTARAPRTSTK
jgi:fatty acid desaturase